MKTKIKPSELTPIELFKLEFYLFKDAAKLEGIKLNYINLLKVFANGLGYPTYDALFHHFNRRAPNTEIGSVFSGKNFSRVIRSLFESGLIPDNETCHRICLAALDEKDELYKEHLM